MKFEKKSAFKFYAMLISLFGILFFLCKFGYKKYKIPGVITFITIYVIIAIFIFFGPRIVTIKNTYFSKDNLPHRGVWIRYNIDDGKVTKEWLGMHKCNAWLCQLNKDKTGYNKKYCHCTLFEYFFWHFCMAGQWKSIKRKNKLCKECKYIAYVYDINEKKLQWTEEYCPSPLNYQTKPSNLKQQMMELNRFLEANDLYLVDFHLDNIRLKDGIIKVIDGEFVNGYELFMCRLFYKLYGHAMSQYSDLSRIYWSYEHGRVPIDSLWKLDNIK